jgi:hypothetical protein
VIRVEPGFVEDMQSEECSGACTFVLTGFTEPVAARRGMEAARRALCSVPHPLEPEDSLPNFVDDLVIGPGRISFTADGKDELGDPDVAAVVADALVRALNGAGADGILAVADPDHG